MKKIFLLFFSCAFFPLYTLFFQPAVASEFEAEVLEVVDGDTIKIRHQDQVLRVRLQGIDAPERNQPFGSEATNYLATKVDGMRISILSSGHDKYGRLLGKIMLNGEDINRHLLELGYAWWYRYYRDQQSLTDQHAYELAEEKAKFFKRGLWSDPEPINPYEWRKKHGT